MSFPQRIDGKNISKGITFEEILDRLKGLVKKGGPEREDFPKIKNMCDALMHENLTVEQSSQLYEILKPIFTLESVIGHTFLKPYGYAGDFELINKIYNNWESTDGDFKNWDRLYQWADSASAVRNRKIYFVNQVQKRAIKKDDALVLNLGSGPCTDVLEYFQSSPKSKVTIECVDMDDKAIEFGSVVCDNYHDSITFTNKNVFLYKNPKKFDLIWSAGLFDYFNDKLFVRLTKRYFHLLDEGGELIIGNFSQNNPSRGLMEVLCQWYLHHRSEEKLIELALKAGIPRDKIEVRAEETGINLFMHINK